MTLRRRIESTMRKSPMPFQVRGVRFLLACDGHAINADHMGLGKTYQAIAYLALNPDVRPAVVVCPATAKYVWRNQLLEHAGMQSSVLEGSVPRIPIRHDMLIINYDILHLWVEVLRAIKPGIIIFDEFQKIKNREARRTRFAYALARQRRIMGLSGTPITSRPVEFFPILNMIAPKVFPSFQAYAMRYCGAKLGYRGKWDFRGHSNLDELHRLVAPFMIRRLKRDVLPELPRKRRAVVPITLSNRGEYDRASHEFRLWMAKHGGISAVKRARRAEAMVRLQHMRMLAAQGKIKTICEWIDDWYETDPNGKLILFCVHRDIVRQFQERFGSIAVSMHGATPTQERTSVIDAFQHQTRKKLFIGTIRTAGESITLTASSTVLFAELGWTPAEHDQAEDRVLRIGQRASKMMAYYFAGIDTVDERHIQLLDRKRMVTSTVVDGREDGDIKLAMLNDLAKRRA